jgi:hypothetical protein
MKTSPLILRMSAVALAASLAGCATWDQMDRSEKGTAVGATGGAVAGAAVAGPVGAAVGAGVGAYAGHHQGSEPPAPTATIAAADPAYDPSLVRSVQQALAQRGYNAGPVDGQWGPNTESALREFQQSRGLPQTGGLNQPTLSALGVAQ